MDQCAEAPTAEVVSVSESYRSEIMSFTRSRSPQNTRRHVAGPMTLDMQFRVNWICLCCVPLGLPY